MRVLGCSVLSEGVRVFKGWGGMFGDTQICFLRACTCTRRT